MRAWLQRNGIGKGTIIVSLIMLAIIVGLVGNLVYKANEKNYTMNEETVVVHLPNSIKIEEEVTVYNAAIDLESQGIMKADTFRYKVKDAYGYNTDTKMIKGGYYTIPPKIHYKELMNILGLKLY